MIYLAFVFGLVFGSFLNVMIYRLNPAPQLRGGGFGRSLCPNCKTQLKWRDLIPLISFIWLRGRCRYCHKKISWQYPIVEVLLGFIWLGVFYQNFNGNFQLIFNFQSIFNLQFLNLGILKYLNFIYDVFVFSAFLIVAVYDFKWKIIPDKAIYPAIIVVFLYNIFNSVKFQNFEMFIWPLLVAIAAFIFFFLIYFFSKGRAMGLGDAKLAFLIGLFLSPISALAAFMLAFIIGAVSGIILIGLGEIFSHYKKWGMESQIALGPFLIIGTITAFFFSDFIIRFFQLNS